MKPRTQPSDSYFTEWLLNHHWYLVWHWNRSDTKSFGLIVSVQLTFLLPLLFTRLRGNDHPSQSSAVPPWTTAVMNVIVHQGLEKMHLCWPRTWIIYRRSLFAMTLCRGCELVSPLTAAVCLGLESSEMMKLNSRVASYSPNRLDCFHFTQMLCDTYVHNISLHTHYLESDHDCLSQFFLKYQFLGHIPSRSIFHFLLSISYASTPQIYRLVASTCRCEACMEHWTSCSSA